MNGQNLQNVVQALEAAVTKSGARLATLSEISPLLLVFLRHAGCPFCREALSDLARARGVIEATGTRIVMVHMGDSAAMGSLTERYRLDGVDSICDRDQRLYRAFGLKRGRLWQLFGPKVVRRALREGVLFQHGIGIPSADSLQMPGLFLIGDCEIVRRFRHRTASDRPDYVRICATPHL